MDKIGRGFKTAEDARGKSGNGVLAPISNHIADHRNSHPARQISASSAGFHKLMLPHLDSAYNLARHLSRDADAADDIVQEAFLRGYRAFDSYRGGDARYWMLTITRNCFFDWAKARQADPLRAAKHGTSLDQKDGGEIEFFDPDRETPEGALVRRDETEKVLAVMETLLEPFREVLVLRELEELSYQQIAAITAVPIGTVMSRLARGRQMFAEAWRQFIGERDASVVISGRLAKSR